MAQMVDGDADDASRPAARQPGWRAVTACRRSGRATPTWSSSAARAPGSRRSRASATWTTPAASASPTPATPIHGSRPRSPSRRARSSTPSRTSSTTSPAWSCTSDCRGPSPALAHGEEAGLFLSNSGAEAIEAAVKLAKYATRRPGIIAFRGGFHGRTHGAMSLTSSGVKYRGHYEPLLAGVHFAPFPYAAAQPDRALPKRRRWPSAWPRWRSCSRPSSTRRTWPPSWWSRSWARAATWSRRTASCPRCARSPTGTASCSSPTRCSPASAAPAACGPASGPTPRPDILVMAKGIASGMPLSGIMARRELLEKFGAGLPRRHVRRQRGRLRGGAGHAGRDRGRGAAGQRARARATGCCPNLRRVAAEHASVAEVRGRGLMVGIEFAEGESG